METTVYKVFASNDSRALWGALRQVKTRVLKVRKTLKARFDLVGSSFFYHYYYNAQYKGIQRVAKKWGIPQKDLDCLVNWFFPEGIY